MKWALLLSGGSALGAVQVPVIEALIAEHGLPSKVSGTSVGAVHTLLVAEGRHAELRPIWQEVKGRGFFMDPNLDVWRGLFSLAPLRRVIEDRGAGKKLIMPACVGTTDLARGEHRLIQLNDITWAQRVDAAICSSQQPVIHQREKFKGGYLSDGGVTHVIPPMPDHDNYDLVAAVFCSPVGKDRDRPTLPQSEVDNAFEQGLAALDLFIDRVVQDDFERIKGWVGTKRIVYAPSGWDVIGPSLQAERVQILARLAEGERMALGPVWEGR
jgi:predicted acylesterase/phospholipase RssA